MNIFRTYGNKPYSIVLVHGGPGGGGEMAPIGRHLSDNLGVLEPIQTKKSIQNQISELKSTIDEECDLPVILIGYSWGAWLSLLLTIQFETSVKKIILIGSGPFEEKYIEQLRTTRMSRLSKEERQEFESIISELNSGTEVDKDTNLKRLGILSSISDNFNPMKKEATDRINVKDSGEIFQKVWGEAAELRGQGQLIEIIKEVKCPVAAFHGDYDPHPYKGVEQPLSKILKDFKLHLLKKCGHTPWLEKEAHKEFYRILSSELDKN